eukprot:s3109_g2.t1
MNSAQQKVCDRVGQSLAMHGEPPEGLTAELALASLKGVKTGYDGVPSNLAPFDPSKLKILATSVAPQHIKQFLPPEAKKLITSPQDFMLKPPDPDPSGFRPYWDPVLRFDSKKRLSFILDLFKAGLMVLRPQAASCVGVFFVKKKSPDAIRMVIDCRGTNQLCQDPPTTRLGSARCYSDLRLEPSAEADTPCAWGREADVNDCFYRFGLPELAHYFALNHPLKADEWRQLGVNFDKIYDPQLQREVEIDGSALLYPCFRAVPMGWNWALFLCHHAVLEIAQRGAPWEDGVLREKKVIPQFNEYKTILGVYVDNITVLGKNKQDVAYRCQLLAKAFADAQIPITWSQDEPVERLESVGCLLDLKHGIIQNKPHRVWKFAMATSALLKRRKLTAEVLQVWTGHYTSLCAITPWGLSALQQVYRFIQKAGTRRLEVWPSVRAEMKMAYSLAWLTWRDLTAPIMRTVETGDASSSGYALMACYPPTDLTWQAMRVHEKWRFIAMPSDLREAAVKQDIEGFTNILADLLKPIHDNKCEDRQTLATQAAALSTEYGRFVLNSLKEGSMLKTSAAKAQLVAKPSKRFDLEIPALVQPLDNFFTDSDNYRLLWSRRWKYIDENITLKEGRVALSSLKRSSRVSLLHGFRKLTISDNLGVVCAISKGRSSHDKLNNLCRQAASLQFATGIVWHLRHVETKRNVADEPSRNFEPHFSRQNDSVKRHRGQRAEPQCERELIGDDSPRAVSACSKPVSNPVAKRFVFPVGHGKAFLEIFSGGGSLTRAVADAGLDTVEPIDYVNGPHCDVRRKASQELILKWIRNGVFGFIHLGTPCTIWSRARHGVKESLKTRCKEEDGLEMALFSAKVIAMCHKHRIPFALENPGSSKLFQFEPVLRALQGGRHWYVNFDMCQYGEPWKKNTTIVTSHEPLCELERKCNHGKHAVWLKGQVQVKKPDGTARYVNRTALAGAYPAKLVEAYAGILRRTLDLKLGEPNEVQATWSAALRSRGQRRGKGSKKRDTKQDDQLTRYDRLIRTIRPERMLRVKRVKPKTLLLYSDHIEEFKSWCSLRKRTLKSLRQVDISMASYFNDLFIDGSAQNTASYTLFGWIALKTIPTGPEKDLLPLSRAALSAWRGTSPAASRVGVPPQVVNAFAEFCIAQGHIDAAAAALLQYDLYARPSEILGVRGVDIVSPVSSLSSFWGVIFGNADFGVPTKAGAFDDIVLADSPHRSHAGKILQHIHRKFKQSPEFVFPQLTLPFYESLFRDFSKVHKLDAQVIGFLAFCGPGLFNALNGLGNAGSNDAQVAAMANGCLYCTFAIFGYFGAVAFNLWGPKMCKKENRSEDIPVTNGGLTYAFYAICIFFSAQIKALALLGGVVLGVGAGFFWAAQGSLMMAYATPKSRGRLISIFWVIFNLGGAWEPDPWWPCDRSGCSDLFRPYEAVRLELVSAGVMGGLLQFALNFHTEGANVRFVAVMVLGACMAPMVLAEPSSVVREDGSPVLFQQAESASEEFRSAIMALKDPFILRNLLFYLASNWFYTYNFNGFNGHQFNIRTRGLNSAAFWAAQMWASARFGQVLDADAPPRQRARQGMLLVALGLLLSLGMALQDSRQLQCHGHLGWDKGNSCQLDLWHDAPYCFRPMAIFILLGAADAIYQNYVYWLMSMAAGSDVRKTAMYSAVYKGVQSLGAGMAWIIDLSEASYFLQGALCLTLTLGALDQI